MKALRVLAILCVVAGAAAALSAPLKLGSPAPLLDIKKWYKGEPVKGLEKDKTYVVEFWATWCGPCKDNMPHLTEMAKANPDVTFIGVSIWEDDRGSDIADFVKSMGDKMDYHVGYSGNKTGMAKTWMDAAAQDKIPTAFVVKNSRIEWIGYPAQLAEPLKEIKSGTFNAAEYEKVVAKKQQATEKAEALQKAVNSCIDLFDSGKHAEAEKRLSAIIKLHPEMESGLGLVRFRWLAHDDPKAWQAKVDEMVATKDLTQLRQLGDFATAEAEAKHGAHDLARKAIDICLKAYNNSDVLILNAAVEVYDDLKEYRLALDTAKLFLKLVPTSIYRSQDYLIKQMEHEQADLEAKLKSAHCI